MACRNSMNFRESPAMPATSMLHIRLNLPDKG